jgi:hypothetical protein
MRDAISDTPELAMTREEYHRLRDDDDTAPPPPIGTGWQTPRQAGQPTSSTPEAPIQRRKTSNRCSSFAFHVLASHVTPITRYVTFFTFTTLNPPIEVITEVRHRWTIASARDPDIVLAAATLCGCGAIAWSTATRAGFCGYPIVHAESSNKPSRAMSLSLGRIQT